MSQEYIRVSEKTLDDAITTACQKLSVTSDKLDYRVIDRGSNGFLGFNARPAVIEARIKAAKEETDKIFNDLKKKVEEVSAEKPVEEKKEGRSEKPETGKASDKKISGENPVVISAEESADNSMGLSVSTVGEEKESGEHRKNKNRNRNRNRNRQNRENREIASDSEKTDQAVVKSARKQETPRKKEEKHYNYSDETIAEAKKRAENFLKDTFAAMKMDVEVSTEFDSEENILTVTMDGEDMGVLIGKRGQTLDSLQYLISLIVNKDMEGYIHVKADTENYRERRKKTLESLAKNIAFKVKRNRKSVTLEPMNPNERRIIHSTLQNDHYVTTYSVGEEPFRKVVVALKKQDRN